MALLRPQRAGDLPLLTGGQSPFDEFGPRSPRPQPAPAELDGAGALTVVDDTGEVAGEVTWLWRHWGPTAGSRCLMVGIWLRPGHRGRGLGSRAQRELVDLAFRHTTTNRVEAATDVENLAEQRALEAAGFRREGVIRGAQWRDGTHRDNLLYAVLRHDARPT